MDSERMHHHARAHGHIQRVLRAVLRYLNGAITGINNGLVYPIHFIAENKGIPNALLTTKRLQLNAVLGLFNRKAPHSGGPQLLHSRQCRLIVLPSYSFG